MDDPALPNVRWPRAATRPARMCARIYAGNALASSSGLIDLLHEAPSRMDRKQSATLYLPTSAPPRHIVYTIVESQRRLPLSEARTFGATSHCFSVPSAALKVPDSGCTTYRVKYSDIVVSIAVEMASRTQGGSRLTKSLLRTPSTTLSVSSPSPPYARAKRRRERPAARGTRRRRVGIPDGRGRR